MQVRVSEYFGQSIAKVTVTLPVMFIGFNTNALGYLDSHACQVECRIDHCEQTSLAVNRQVILYTLCAVLSPTVFTSMNNYDHQIAKHRHIDTWHSMFLTSH